MGIASVDEVWEGRELQETIDGRGVVVRPWGNAAGAAANRVALEACVEARNAGRQVEKEGKEILVAAAKSSPELKVAMETWKEIKFEFDVVDKLDVAHA